MGSVRGFNSLPRLFRLRASRVAVIGSWIQRWKPLLPSRPGGCDSAAEYRPYLGAVAGTLAECWIESFLITISSRLNGGEAFAGKSGRRTANTCEPKATEMNMIAAAYFMSRGLIKIQKRDKKNLGAIAVIRGKGWWLVICENATSLQEKAIL